MHRRAGIALLLGAAGCTGGVRPDLHARDPAQAIPAMKLAARDRDLAAAGRLVHDLRSDDPAVRFYSISALKHMTGQSLGYHYYAPPDERLKAVRRWELWLAQQGSATRPAAGKK